MPVPTLASGDGPLIRPALVAVAASLGAADAAVSAGADIIDVGDAVGLDVAAFLATHPGVALCAADHRAVLTRQAAIARVTGALLICDDPAQALASGVSADRLVVLVPPGAIAAVTRAGFAAMVDVDQVGLSAARPDPDTIWRSTLPEPDPAFLAGCVAAAALSAWLGAALIRTRYPVAMRRALDMTATIQGLRPPARTVRGLA